MLLGGCGVQLQLRRQQQCNNTLVVAVWQANACIQSCSRTCTFGHSSSPGPGKFAAAAAAAEKATAAVAATTTTAVPIAITRRTQSSNCVGSSQHRNRQGE